MIEGKKGSREEGEKVRKIDGNEEGYEKVRKGGGEKDKKGVCSRVYRVYGGGGCRKESKKRIETNVRIRI